MHGFAHYLHHGAMSLAMSLFSMVLHAGLHGVADCLNGVAQSYIVLCNALYGVVNCFGWCFIVPCKVLFDRLVCMMLCIVLQEVNRFGWCCT